MKFIFLLVFTHFCTLSISAQTPRCDYEALMRDGEAFFKKREYKKALNKFNAAKTCDIVRATEVDKALNEVFKAIEKEKIDAINARKEADKQRNIAIQQKELALRNEKEAAQQRDSVIIERNNVLIQRNNAEKKAREIYANELAYKSQIALKSGDRNTAFRLAEFAHRYVDTTDNHNVLNALFSTVYYNDINDSAVWMSRYYMLEGHKSSVADIEFSKDGNILVTAGLFDNSAKIWDVNSGKNILTIKYSNSIRCIAISPDGSLVATGSDDYKIKVWVVKTGECVLTLAGHNAIINDLAFSPDGLYIASCSDDDTSKIWLLKNGENIITLKGHTKTRNKLNSVTCLSYSPDGQYLADGGLDDDVIIWEVKSGKAILTIKGHTNTVKCLAFSPDAHLLATVSVDKTIRIWDAITGKNFQTIFGHLYEINSVSFSKNGKLLATGSNDKTAKIWDIYTGKCLYTFKHEDVVTSVCFSPDGKLLATGSDDDVGRIWNLSADKNAITIGDIGSTIQDIDFSPDSSSLAVALKESPRKYKIIVYNFINNDIVFETWQDNSINSLAYSPTGKWLAIGEYNYIKGIELINGNQVFKFDSKSKELIKELAFSQNGKLLASCDWSFFSKPKPIYVWNIDSLNLFRILKGHEGNVNSVIFLSDNNTIISGSDDGTIKIWDIESNKLLLTLIHEKLTGKQNYKINSLSISNNNELLATAADNKRLKIWDLQKQKLVTTLQSHNSSIEFVSFSPNNKFLCTSSIDNEIKIWDTNSFQDFLTFNGQINWIKKAVFSPDSKRIATVFSTSYSKGYSIEYGPAKIWEITCDGLIERWYSTGHGGSLLTSTLQEFKLEQLLDFMPQNEFHLLSSGDLWQIAAFSDLYFNKIRNTSIPQKEDYERALRLFDYCEKNGEATEYFSQRIEELKKMWKEKTE